MRELENDRKRGARPPGLAGITSTLVISVAIATLAGVAKPAGAAIIVVSAVRDLLHGAYGVYEATALTPEVFEVDRTWRGQDYHVLVLPYVEDPQLATCMGPGRVEPGDRYLVTVYCAEPAEFLEGNAVFECEASARPQAQAEELLEALHRGVVISRGDLISDLRLWQTGIDTSVIYDWLVEADNYAEVDDWETAEDGFSYSLTGGVISELVALVSQILDCDPGSAERVAHFENLRHAVLPVLIELLESSSTSEEELDALEDFFLDYEVDC